MSEPLILGWREWVALPDLGLMAIRCKVDTGAATSSLHATDIVRSERDGVPWARFSVRPFHQRYRHLVVVGEAPITDEREVTSSSGHADTRVVVQTQLRLGLRADAPVWAIELTLTDRASMKFPMLLGREAMAGRVLVDAGASYRLGQLTRPTDFYQ
ncbi:MAG: ATP-dependent zinc protease [Rhodothermaceae bacterium]|nr:ATP-dependent zinc protease [Rhodothermaceae bacterium]